MRIAQCNVCLLCLVIGAMGWVFIVLGDSYFALPHFGLGEVEQALVLVLAREVGSVYAAFCICIL